MTERFERHRQPWTSEELQKLKLLAGKTLPLIRSVFRDGKKLSIAALPQTLPERIIEQVTPLSPSDS